MTKPRTIKLPVRYDEDNHAVVDAEGHSMFDVDNWQVGYAKDFCKAVNAHDDLVEALQDLHIESTETYGHWPELKLQVEAALKKAGA